jgi:8-oxo-dGTP diphosphatase
MEKKIGIAVHVLVRKFGRVLMGERADGESDGTWCLPGGKLDEGESPEAGARRELRQETGIEVGKLHFLNLTSDVNAQSGEHYIHICFWAATNSEPELREPDEFARWEWFDPDHLPEPIFFGQVKMLDAIGKKLIFSD